MVNISKLGDSTIKFTFTDNDRYLYNGEITLPLNSLILEFDTSDLVIFKKIDGDVFVTFLLENSNFASKAELESWYKENMVGSTGGGGGVDSGTVQTMIDTSTANYFDNAEYDSGTTRINFYHNNTIKAYIDASAFIVDGMIDNVSIETISGVSYLVIDFNTASGKEDIQIPLTDIFDPSNYYTKTEVDASLSGKQDTLSAGTNITISGNVISAEGGGNPTVELTQAQYDALVTAGTVSADTYYIITDATPIDISNYYTTAQTDTAIDAATSGKVDTSTFETYSGSVETALSGKQDTLVSGTNIKTINNESLLGSGNIDIQGGGSITIDPSLDSGSTNAVANSAITTAIEAVSGAIPSTYISSISVDNDQGYQRFFRFRTPSDYNYFLLNNAKINNRAILSTSWGGFDTNFSLVETSAITTSVTSSSTDAQVPSAKAVYDKLGGLSLVKLSQSEYDSLATKDNSTLYVIVN